MSLTIPPVPTPSFPDPAIARWGQQVSAAFNALRAGGVITQSDVDALVKKYSLTDTGTRKAQPGDIQVTDGAIPLSDLVEKLLANRQFQDALTTKSTTTTTSGQDDVAVHDLEARLMQVINDLKASVSSASSSGSTGATARGPVSVGAYGQTSWSDEFAARGVYQVVYNGGDLASIPSITTAQAVAALVIGDTVTFRDQQFGASTYIQTKQWLGTKIGWVESKGTNSLESVVNLPQFITGVVSVIPETGKLANTAQVRGSTLKQGTGSTVANPTLEQVIHELDYTSVGSQAYNTLQELAKTNTKRGPIWASYGIGDLSYSDSIAPQLIWAQLNRGNTWQGFYPGMPNPSDFLVTGDTVTVSWGKDQYGAASQMVSKMWHGSSLGWQFFTSPYVAFQDVQNLPQFLDGVTSVIPARGQINSATVIAGGSLAKGDRTVKSNPTIADILHELDYNSPGTQAWNTLQELAKASGSGGGRAPISRTLPTGGNTGIALGVNLDYASWAILYVLLGYNNPNFWSPFPTAFLVKGDMINFTDAATGVSLGVYMWNGSAWAQI